MLKDLDNLAAIADRFSDLGRAPAVISHPSLHDDCVARRISTESTKDAVIMVVDDEPVITKVVSKYLKRAGYKNFIATSHPQEVLGAIRREQPDVLLLDILMPHVSGLTILREMRECDQMQQIPVLILTELSNSNAKIEALELGATDFLSKPVDPNELVVRVRNALVVKAHHDYLSQHKEQLENEVRQRTIELVAARKVVECLARAAEFRDDETGRHVVRVGKYAAIVAEEMGFDSKKCRLMELAAQLHDVGKIGVPDAILLKPGKLEPHEFAVIQKHCGFGKTIIQPLEDDEVETMQAHSVVGAKILDGIDSPLITLAAAIAQSHHERWDGTGYPNGLAAAEIPLEGRITAVADVFDALSTKRPYKPAFPLEKCFAIMEDSRGTHFDPAVLDAFFARRIEITEVQIRYADSD